MHGSASNHEKALACKANAELAEQTFYRRKQFFTAGNAVRTPLEKYRLDKALADDDEAQSAISDNRWYISQATMYALLALLEK